MVAKKRSLPESISLETTVRRIALAWPRAMSSLTTNLRGATISTLLDRSFEPAALVLNLLSVQTSNQLLVKLALNATEKQSGRKR